MHISITLSIALLMACLCAANADELTVERNFLQQSGMQEDARTSIRNDEVTALREQNAVLKAQNQALREFQDGIFATLWSVIGMVVVFIGLLTYFQSRISDREAQSIKDEVIKPLRQFAIEYSKFFLVSVHTQVTYGASGAHTDEIRNDIESCLRRIGLSESEFSSVLDAEYPYVCRQYYQNAINDITPKLRQNHPDEWRKFHSKYNDLDFPDPSELRSFISTFNDLPDIERKIKDFEYYYDNRRHRCNSSLKDGSFHAP